MKRGLRMNRNAQSMTIGTLVVMILGIIVLVVLAYGFTVGWGDLFSRITGLGGGKVNVQTVVQSCQIACSTQSSYDYCTRTRGVVFDETDAQRNKIPITCSQLETENVGLERCSSIPNCNAVLNKGVCSGTPITPDCGVRSNGGRTNCEQLMGCTWEDNTVSTDPNVGTCKAQPNLVCGNYNDREADCESIGCQFTPTA